MVRDIFKDKYKDCRVTEHPGYQLGEIARPDVYSVDCIFKRLTQGHGERCDDFVFFDLRKNVTGIYLIERKDNSQHDVKKVTGQLQGGANFIGDFLEKDPATDRQPFDFLPVWVSRGIRPAMRSALIKARVSLRSEVRQIYHVKKKGTLPVFGRRNNASLRGAGVDQGPGADTPVWGRNNASLRMLIRGGDAIYCVSTYGAGWVRRLWALGWFGFGDFFRFVA